MDLLNNLIVLFGNMIGLFKEFIFLIIIKFLLGSGVIGVFIDIIKNFGLDIKIGFIVLVVMGIIEIIFYIIIVYFGVVKVKKIRYILWVVIMVDIIVIIMVILVVNLFIVKWFLFDI